MPTCRVPAAIVFALLALIPAPRAQEQPPLRLAIAGLVHGHVGGFLRAAQVVTPQANNTTLAELSGISTAHVNGDNKPAAAMLTPTML